VTRIEAIRRLVPALGVHAAALALRGVPRSSRIVAVGSHSNAFADNSKYLYIELLRERPDLRVVWISGSEAVVRHVRERGGEAYVRWSPAGVRMALRAKTWFVSAYASDVNAYFSHGATVVNLWHGIPLKKIERDIDSGPLERVFRRPTLMDRVALHTHAYRRPDFFLSPSETVSRAIFSRAFAVPLGRCISAAPPRIAPLVCDRERFEAMLPWCDEPTRDALGRVGSFRAYHLYLPTWRETRPRFLGDLLPYAPPLDAAMRRRGEAFVLKPHAATPRDLLEEFARYPNLVAVDPAADAYPLLRSAATLITDYSSVFFDFLFVERPIIFFPFDLEQYRSGDRGFYFPYETHTPGPIARTMPELLALLDQPDGDRWRAARARSFDWAYGGPRPPSALSVVNALLPS
jgi:CDP-glycerol glycerophosphotransferase (TagB/SpsB family)